jgi:hypothetical protein
MKTLKITSLLLLLSFMACKKDKVAPEPVEEPFEIRQFVLVTKETKSNGWVDDIRLRTFDAQGKCIIFTETGAIPDNGFSYSYDNGVLKLFYDGRLNNELKIENKIITSSTASAAGRSFKLIKIPKDNPLNGNTYAGGWKAEGSLLTTIASLKFSDTHYSEASINLPEPNKTYELIKNIAAYKKDVTNEVLTLWVLSDGILEGYRTYYGNNNSNRVTGTFTKK